MSEPLHVLVPPSEAKAPGGEAYATPGRFDAALDAPRSVVLAALVDAVAAASDDHRRRLLGARGELLERSCSQVALLASGAAPQLAAWRRYQGVVWTHLAAASLEEGHRRRLLVPSALYGLTTGEDPVADYRLKMTVSLPGPGRLSTYWRAPVNAALVSSFAGATLVDLLPREHGAVIDAATLEGRLRVVRVDFVDAQGAGAAGHAAKAVKGVLARRLLLHGEAALERFSWRGWRLRRGGGRLRVVAPR